MKTLTAITALLFWTIFVKAQCVPSPYPTTTKNYTWVNSFGHVDTFVFHPWKKPVVVTPLISITEPQFRNLSNVSNRNYHLAPGTYSNGYYLSNIHNCTFDGGNAVTFTSNVNLSGQIHGFTLQHVKMNGATVEITDKKTTPYTDSTSYDSGITLRGITSNTELMDADGHITATGGFNGITSHLVIDSCTFKGGNPGAYIYVGNCQACEIEHLTIDSADRASVNDVGFIQIQGTANIHDISMDHSYGHIFRGALFKNGGLDTCNFYNLTDQNSLKYSLAEIQMQYANLFTNSFTPPVINFHDNYAYNFGLGSRVSYSYVMLDNYPNGNAVINYWNNTGSLLWWNTVTPNNLMLNPLGGTVVDKGGNIYTAP